MTVKTLAFSFAIGVTALTGPACAVEEDSSGKERLLVIVAHPDDELFVGPALAARARQGAQVRIVYATRGDQGPGVSGIQRGEALAARRSEEARCAASALGVSAPVFLHYGDGSMGRYARAGKDEPRNPAVVLAREIDRFVPDTIITWGPDGGYGHPDHRMIGALIAELAQDMSANTRPQLLYPGIRTGTLPPMRELSQWKTTAPDLLSVTIDYNDADLAATAEATQCHKTQFDAATRGQLVPVFHDAIWQGAVRFRPAFAGSGKTAPE